MERLEPKLLGKILWMIRREDQKNLLRVSKQWYQIIDETIGIDVTIGRGTGLKSENEILDSIQVLGKVGIRSCKLNDYVNDSSTVVPSLKHPNLLQVFSISNFVSTKTLENILTGVTNLHTLKIGPNALYHLEFSDMGFFTFPCQVLEIVENEFNEDDDDIFWWIFGRRTMDLKRLETVCINLLYLLRKSFPRLKRFNMKLRVLEEMYQQFNIEVSNFLNNHAETLTEFNIRRYKDSVFMFELEKENPAVIANEMEPLQIPDRQFNKMTRIEYRHEIPSSGFEHEMAWALRATNLEELYFSFNYPESFLKSIVLNNEATLMALQIGLFVEWNILSFDCDLLKNCANLRIFGITCWKSRFERFDYESPSTVKMLNVTSLPKKIMILSIIYVHLTSESCEAIFHHLPNLYQISLVFKGENGSGVPSPVVHEILRKKKIRKFMLTVASGTDDYSAYTSLPIDTSMQFHDPEGDPENTPNHHMLHAALNDEGEYQITKLSI